MTRIDLDDLPPRIAGALAALPPGEEIVLVQGGAVVARLAVAEGSTGKPGEPALPPEQDMKEIMDHFNSMIHDEF
ncbi:MAG: hypothetical protein ACREEB_17395 [Caulobacteraceae bacterium]